MFINTMGLYADTHYRNYQTLLLHQYHLKIDGLWKLNSNYFILCLDLNDSTLAIDGQSLKQWYHDHSIVGASTPLVNRIPEGAERVPNNTIEDVANFVGSPRNYTFLLNDLLTFLPKEFPEFKLNDKNNGVVYFVTELPLNDAQETSLTLAIKSMRIAIRMETTTSEDLSNVKQYILKEEIVIRHHKTFQGLKGRNIIRI